MLGDPGQYRGRREGVAELGGKLLEAREGQAEEVPGAGGRNGLALMLDPCGVPWAVQSHPEATLVCLKLCHQNWWHSSE